MTQEEKEFMQDLAILLDNHNVSIEATMFNLNVQDRPSINISGLVVDIDLYGNIDGDEIEQILKRNE